LFNTDTDLFCVIGHPVAHSLSPVIHNRAFRETGINGVYLAFDIENLRDFITGLREMGIRGVSVTIPHKEKVMEYTDEIDSVAGYIGAVNTLFYSDGMIRGYNTDGTGAMRALQEKTATEGKNVLLLGSGGAARAISVTLAKDAGVRSIMISGIERDQMEKLKKDTVSAASGNTEVGLSNADEITPELTGRYDIIINATPVGMTPETDASILEENHIRSSHTVFDVVYNPMKTRLLEIAGKKGAEIISGVRMFLFQAAAQFEIWTGADAPLDVMEEVIYSAFGNRRKNEI